VICSQFVGRSDKATHPLRKTGCNLETENRAKRRIKFWRIECHHQKVSPRKRRRRGEGGWTLPPPPGRTQGGKTLPPLPPGLCQGSKESLPTHLPTHPSFPSPPQARCAKEAPAHRTMGQRTQRMGMACPPTVTVPALAAWAASRGARNRMKTMPEWSPSLLMTGGGRRPGWGIGVPRGESKDGKG